MAYVSKQKQVHETTCSPGETQLATHQHFRFMKQVAVNATPEHEVFGASGCNTHRCKM